MVFFCFKALEHGCTKAYGIEAHKDYYEPTVAAITAISGLEWVFGYFPEITEKKKLKADVVMALSLVHHLFAKHPLADIVKSLWETAELNVIVEWIDINDAQVQKYGHCNNPEYRKNRFEEEILKRFTSLSYIGEGHHPTRFIYLLTK